MRLRNNERLPAPDLPVMGLVPKMIGQKSPSQFAKRELVLSPSAFILFLL